ncbi:hypothetical protein V1264_007108 [Littorina saxatilis]|uniref:Uncharacterized protein n=1 Tax=Littorina saxatilis TaxID=31220 RepID=A0AAN9G2U9_9CAEN
MSGQAQEVSCRSATVGDNRVLQERPIAGTPSFLADVSCATPLGVRRERILHNASSIAQASSGPRAEPEEDIGQMSREAVTSGDRPRSVPVTAASNTECTERGFLPEGSAFAQDSSSVYGSTNSEQDEVFRLPARFIQALALAAEVTSRYFPEGVVAAVDDSAPPKSAVDDFLPSQPVASGFRFSESPLVAYEMAKVLATHPPLGSNIPLRPVPLLVAHGPVPPSVDSWLATEQQASVFRHATHRKLVLKQSNRGLIQTFALPRAPLPVTPAVDFLRFEHFKKDKAFPYTESSLLGLEETGRSALELASLSDTLLRSLTRALTSSLEPFEFRQDASEQDVAALLSALAKVSAQQMASSARLYAHAVFTRRDNFLSESRLQDRRTIDSLRTSPFTEEALFGPLALDALHKETQEAKDLEFARYTQRSASHTIQSDSATYMAPAVKGSFKQNSGSSRGRGRGASSGNKKPSFGKSRGSGRNPNPQ